MSRIRSIHPGLWTDEAFVTLTPVARLFLIGLWNECDDRGIFQWSPLQLKMRILPLEGVQPEKLLFELVEAGFVLSYIIAGKQFGAVKNFMKFQHPKKPRFIFPVTDDVCHFVSDGESVPNEFPTGSEPVPIGEEGKGEEGKGELSPNGDSASGDALTLDELVEGWNELALQCGLARVVKLSNRRKVQARARMREFPNIEDWRTVFANLRDARWMHGDNDRGWRADFDFILQPKSFIKLLENSYAKQ